MDEMELGRKLYSYSIYAISIIILIIAILSGIFIIVIISSALLLISILYLHSGHIINNLLFKKSRIIEIKNNYILGNNIGCVFKREGNLFKSISIAELKPESSPNISSDVFSSLIESIHEPFEYSILITEVDKRKILEPLETKRKMKEILLTKINSNKYDKISNIKREIEILDSEISGIKSSGRAFEVKLIIKTISVSESESEATSQSYRSLERIADTFSATLKVNYQIIKGEELLNFIS